MQIFRIIEGAAQGIGLGNQFLGISVEQTYLFLIEPNLNDLDKTINTLTNLKNELNQYDESILLKKDVIIAINKIDLLNKQEENKLKPVFKEYNVILISCFLRQGIEKLEERISNIINESHNY